MTVKITLYDCKQLLMRSAN